MTMEIWDKLRTPPPEALKKIAGGRLKGMTDIAPQWRYQAITEAFGPCGIGWYYEVINRWMEPGSGDQMVAFVEINFYYMHNGSFSRPIPGSGGSMFVAKETAGLHTSDEAYKMATTDALSVATKMIGVGADVYSNHGGKYSSQTVTGTAEPAYISVDQVTEINEKIQYLKIPEKKFLSYMASRLKVTIPDIEHIPEKDGYETALAIFETKGKKVTPVGMNDDSR